MNKQRLIQWINQHDCGVSPTALDAGDKGIEVRVLCVGPAGDRIESEFVQTYQQARVALGY